MLGENYLPFEEARKYVHLLGLKKIEDWENYCVSGKKPDNLPPNPAVVYWKDWKGWKDWFVGTDTETLQEDSTKLEKNGLAESQNSSSQKNHHYLSFEQARDFVHSLKLKTESEWWQYASSGNKPSSIPLAPWKSFENQWKGFDDWLGKIDSSKFLPFEQARDYVRTLGLESYPDWKRFSSSGKRPSNIPSSPNHTYKGKWEGWGDWLGTGRIDTRKIEYLTFEEARKFVRTLGLKNRRQWYDFCKTKNKPSNIPRNPHIKYSKEWKGWKDWFKDSDMANVFTDIPTMEDKTIKALDEVINDLSSKYLPFEQARNYVRTLQLKSSNEWKKFTTSENRQSNIPSNPNYVYREKWKGWDDWLGTEGVRTSKFLPFEQSRDYVRKLGLKSFNDWLDFCKAGKRPPYIPSSPYNTYKKEWKGIGDWLGTGRTRSVKFRPFEQARIYVKSLNISNPREWKEFCRSGNKPSDIPADPSNKYWKEWKGWKDWFGQVFLPFKEARDIVRMLRLRNTTEWEKFCKSGKKPHNIPPDPWRVYSIEWINMEDWLGIKKTDKIMNKFSETTEYLPFEQARDFARSLKLESLLGWLKLCNQGKIPKNIPYNPTFMYEGKWEGWRDWLGIKQTKSIKFLPFEKARKYVRTIGLKGFEEWWAYCKSGSKSKDIPADPESVYIKEWKGWDDWLGIY